MKRREKRILQTERNVIGFFAYHDYYLHVDDFQKTKVDRAYLEPTDSLLALLKALRMQEEILPWRAGIAKHKLDGYDYRTAARGFRQNVFFCSAQIIIHEDEDGTPVSVEIDWDWFNPDIREGIYRVGSLIGHGGEFVWYRLAGTKTNSLRVARVLAERGYPVEVLS